LKNEKQIWLYERQVYKKKNEMFKEFYKNGASLVLIIKSSKLTMEQVKKY